MKCLSLWQPWATLLVSGAKRVETRSWPIRHRGPLLIHAAKTWNGELAAMSKQEPFNRMLRLFGVMWSDKGRPTIPFGAIVGRVNIDDCFRTEHVEVGCEVEMYKEGNAPRLRITETEKAFGDYRDYRFAFLCSNAIPFDKPIPYRGAQGIFDVPDEVIAEALLS